MLKTSTWEIFNINAMIDLKKKKEDEERD